MSMYLLKEPTEKEIENSLLTYLKIKGAFVWKNDSVGIYDPLRKVYRKKHSPHAIKGVSDILGIYKGLPLAIEVKSKKGRVSPEQHLFFETWFKHGGVGGIARSIDDCDGILAVCEERLKGETASRVDQ